MAKGCCFVMMVLFVLGYSTLDGDASMARNCMLKAKVVGIAQNESDAIKLHPDVSFGGVCYTRTFFVQIEALDINNSVFLGNTQAGMPYCEGLVALLSRKNDAETKRPIGIKLCVDPGIKPPKVGDVIDIRYNWTMGRTDTKATVIWKYLSQYMDREPRKEAMSNKCDNGDGSICTQLGQMYWQDKDEDGEIESYRKACELDKGYCTYYQNALVRTGRKN